MPGIDTQLGGAASLAGVFLFLTTLTTVLRFVARHRLKVKVWVDDYAAVASWVGFVGMAAAYIYGMALKYVGYPEPKDKALVAAQHPAIVLVFLSMDFLDIWTLAMSKLSALFFYRRIFCTRAKRGFFDHLTVALIAIVVAWLITFDIMIFNLCGSHSTVGWGVQPENTAKCKLTFPVLRGVSISDFILDVIILVIVFPATWSLTMSRQRKFAISGVFLVALGTIGASCARMVIYIIVTDLNRSLDSEDGYELNTQFQYYALLEAGLSVVCVSLPSIYCLFAGIHIESVFRSLRSFVSLESIRSREPPSSRNQSTSQEDLNGKPSNSYTLSELPRDRDEV